MLKLAYKCEKYAKFANVDAKVHGTVPNNADFYKIVLEADCSLITKLRQQHMLNELTRFRLQCLFIDS